jgi:hypothetical protein
MRQVKRKNKNKNTKKKWEEEEKERNEGKMGVGKEGIKCVDLCVER